jgi:hypothetical protein
MDLIKKKMEDFHTKKEQSRQNSCSEYMKGFDTFFTKFIQTATLSHEGYVYVPIQTGCSKEVLTHLKKYNIKTNPDLAYEPCNCIKINLDDNKNYVAYTSIFDCGYYQTKTN